MPRKTGIDTPPPGLGLLTVTVAVPATTTSAAEIDAVNCELLTNVVARALPFQFTTEPDTKPVPFTVSVNAALPGTTVVGTSGWFTNGTGFDCPSSEVARKTITLKAAKVNLFMFLPQIVDGNGIALLLQSIAVTQAVNIRRRVQWLRAGRAAEGDHLVRRRIVDGTVVTADLSGGYRRPCGRA